MKKKKIKVMNILIAFFLFLFVILILYNVFIMLKKDFKVYIKDLTINVGEEFKNDFKATYKKADVTENVIVETDLNNKVAGVYKVTYMYTKGEKKYTINKKITVIDKEEPKINLKGGKDIVLDIGDKFVEPGYVALDNSDGDITDKVQISGNVDTSKEGIYIITYEVTDKSGNSSMVKRKVNVTKDSPLTKSIKDFTLDGMFKEVTLQKTEDGKDKYIDNIIFAGDSMALYYVINEQIKEENLWYQVSITAETALTSPIYINGKKTNKTFVENFKDYKPEIVIMTLGTNSVAYMEPGYFYEKYFELIYEIQKASPKTKLIIQSIPPVSGELDLKNNNINNDKINKFNYYIGKMCEELNVKFLNSAPTLKDENGVCKKEYCSSDGIHLTKEGQEKLIKFARTHMYIE